MVFNGNLLQLKALVDQLGIPCRWQHMGSFEMAVFDDGVSNLKLNWWPETGQLRLVGDPEVRVDAERRLQTLILK